MECKSKNVARSRLGISELIETLWNVNEGAVNLGIQKSSELIETLWNVNHFHYLITQGGRFELIETLWNVNYFVYVAIIPCVKN